MKNKILMIFAMFLLFMGTASAYTLPDMEPVVTFSSSTGQADIAAVITVVAVDTLENAGIDKIELYQDNQLLDTKTCDSSTCTFIKTITSTTAASHDYYAKVQDLGDHIVQTNTLSITFNGIQIINHPPSLNTIGNKQVNENQLVEFSVSAIDDDGDSIIYSASNLPSGATFSSETFSWTPTYTQSGSYDITFTVSDSEYNVTETITITVSNVNRAPILNSIGNKQIDENTTLQFTISAADPDSDSITYSASNLPSGASFDTATFSWTPGFDQTGNYQITFYASDGSLSDSETISITVGDINRPPELASIGNKQIDENSTLQFTINATDSDGNLITYSATGLPFGANFASGTFTWTPSYTQSGSYNITFTASDGILDDSEQVTINVTNVNQGSPSINSKIVLIKVINATDNSYTWYLSDDLLYITYRNATFEVDASDLDNDTLEYQWQLTGPLASLANSAKFNYPFTTPGVYNLTLIINDTQGGTDTTQWIINVTEPLVYGTVYDIDNRTALADINVSVYNASVYNVSDGSGNYSSLTPKEAPDTVTDKNGNYMIAGPLASLAQAHLVFEGSDEKDFNVYVEKGKSKKHDVELDEDRVKTNLNAEGHILYSGKYEHNNSYTCGDKVKFTMFGVNNGNTSETITFAVQDHTLISGPTAPIIYNGSISDPDESLTINAGNKTHGVFEYTLNCPIDEGRYDIHVVWDNSTWHKIGNFFVVNDTTAPEITNWDTEVTTYTNQTVEIGYIIKDIAEPGTVRVQEDSIQSDNNSITIYLDKNIYDDSDSDGIEYNDPDVSSGGSCTGGDWITCINATYNQSGHYTARIFAVDESGNTEPQEHYVNVSVYITEDEADVIGDALYNSYGALSFNQDYSLTVGSSTPTVTLNADRYEDLYFTGDEYMTLNNGLNGQDGINLTEINALETVNYGCTGPEFVKPIYPMVTNEFNYTLDSFFYNLRCRCGESQWAITCSSRNLAPEIWECSPGDGINGIPCLPIDIEIDTTETAPFSILVVDPNNDAFSIDWYDDDELVAINTTSYTFVANSSLVGDHTIKVIALDSTGDNISIENGPHNSWEWTLTVTE